MLTQWDYLRNSLCKPYGVQLSVASEKLTVVTNRGWRKLGVEPPEKGRRYHTFSHTERALVATIYLATACTEHVMHMLSIYMHLQEHICLVSRNKLAVYMACICQAYAKYIHRIYTVYTTHSPPYRI